MGYELYTVAKQKWSQTNSFTEQKFARSQSQTTHIIHVTQAGYLLSVTLPWAEVWANFFKCLRDGIKISLQSKE